MKEFTVIFFCSWKFALTFPVAVYGMKFSFIKTLLFTNIGGASGVLAFTYLSEFIINLWNKYIKPWFSSSKKDKPTFTKQKRKFIHIKSKYGLPGIIILNPIILSIPISSFLIVKFYGRKLKYVLLLFAGQVVWSIIYTVFYFYIYQQIAVLWPNLFS